MNYPTHGERRRQDEGAGLNSSSVSRFTHPGRDKWEVLAIKAGAGAGGKVRDSARSFSNHFNIIRADLP